MALIIFLGPEGLALCDRSDIIIFSQRFRNAPATYAEPNGAIWGPFEEERRFY